MVVRYLLTAAWLLAGSGVAFAQSSAELDGEGAVEQVIDIEDGLNVDGEAQSPKELLTLGREDDDEPTLLPNRNSFVDEMVNSSRKSRSAEDDHADQQDGELEYDFVEIGEQIEGELVRPDGTECGFDSRDSTRLSSVEMIAEKEDMMNELVESADAINE